MSLETRSSAHFKRAEQLRRWEDSETNREPTVPKVKSSKVKFPSSCVFLAACTAGDKDEVLKLLEKGIDINTPNVDGLTALHQACIEDNLDMVEFLVQNGANVNLGDNEGWTPLHATASCGFCSIAKYLIENGADVGAINNDGELAIDIAESDDMLDLLQDEIQKRGIDCEKARGDEQRRMLKDARDWASGECIESMDAPHHKTGATALHIAAAKGYIDVMHILLQNGLVDVDQQDYDGWTPLHAATHWNQREAAKLLVDNLADMEIKNFYRQTPFDVADPDMLKFLEELKVKQSSLNKEIILGKRQAKRKADAPAKIKKVELQIEKDKENDENLVGTVDNNVEKKNRVNAGTTDSSQRIYPPPSSPATTPTSELNNSTKQLPSPTQQAPPSVPPKAIENNTEDIGTIPSWRRPASLRSRLGNDSPTKSLSLRIGDKEQKSPTSPTGKNISDNSDVVLRRTHSFENDEKKDQLTNTTTTSSSASSPQQNTTPCSPPTATVNTANTSPNRTSQSSPTATSPQPNSQVRRSFVPPVRDEESETQRKAHAKRVRETRRSTQGVTLDEIKSAEQLVKQKNQPKNATDQDVTTTVVVTSTSNGDTTSTNGNNIPSVTATITTGAPTVVVPVKRANEDSSSIDQQNIQNNSLHERRPSWRLRVDNGSKFKLEDATATNNATTAGGTPTVFIRRAPTTTPASGQITTRPSSAPVETSVPPSPPADTVVTLPLRRNSKPVEDKEQDKENDVRNAQATQAVIQRRRRPKRRSTGVVHVDMDEIDPDKQDSNAGGDCDDIKLNHQDSGSEQQGNNNKESRLSASRGELIVTRNENGEVDYKKLWEQAQADNDRLRDKLRKQDEELRDTKLTLEKISTVTSKNSLSELEKRERRAMERKLSEMEEELKQLEALKVENQKLKDENGALIRVISKLSK